MYRFSVDLEDVYKPLPLQEEFIYNYYFEWVGLGGNKCSCHWDTYWNEDEKQPLIVYVFYRNR